MKRNITKELENWRISSRRKPLILKGARQVGKTHILKEFGLQCFEKQGAAFYYIDLKEQKKLHKIFGETNDPYEIIRALQFYTQKKINTAKDLIIFDEIQDCPGAIGSLKYFEQSIKELAIIAAGSHMGLVANEESFPVGKVNFLYMFPMTFGEFLMACADDLSAAFENFELNTPDDHLPLWLHQKFLEFLRYYFFTGGLPEVVLEFKELWSNQQWDVTGPDKIRQIQNELIEGYQADFSKYSGTVNANHIHHVFHSIPAQLAKAHDTEVNRYKFSGVIPRQKGFERVTGPLHWLIQSRLCIQTFIANKAESPLKGYCQENKFKIYFFDTGLLHGLLKTPPADILNNSLGSYKGYIAENFVAQELYARTNSSLFAWHEGHAEVEFLVTNQNGITPLEVKASSRSRMAKSLAAYIQRYQPPVAYKASGENPGLDHKKQLRVIPIYFCSKIC